MHQHSAVSPAFGRGGVDEAAEYSRADAAVDGDGGGGDDANGADGQGWAWPFPPPTADLHPR